MAETTNAQTAPEFAQNIDFSSGNIGDGLLSSIFGDSWHNMYDSGPTSAVGPLLVDIFTLYNTAIAMAASAVILFLIMSGTMRAAHEGSFFSRYNSIASVMRGVAGAAGIIPIFGMSLVQMMVLSFAGFGFTTADRIAEMTAAHLSTGRPLTTFPAFHDQNKDKALLALLQLLQGFCFSRVHHLVIGLNGHFSAIAHELSPSENLIRSDAVFTGYEGDAHTGQGGFLDHPELLRNGPPATLDHVHDLDRGTFISTKSGHTSSTTS